MQGKKGTACGAAERARRYKQRHPERRLATQRRWQAKNPGYLGPKRQVMVDIVNAIKATTPCADCFAYWPIECIDFDHVGEKRDGVSHMIVSTGATLDEVLAEIAKCEVVCANCHRKRTAARQRKAA